MVYEPRIGKTTEPRWQTEIASKRYPRSAKLCVKTFQGRLAPYDPRSPTASSSRRYHVTENPQRGDVADKGKEHGTGKAACGGFGRTKPGMGEPCAGTTGMPRFRFPGGPGRSFRGRRFLAWLAIFGLERQAFRKLGGQDRCHAPTRFAQPSSTPADGVESYPDLGA